MLYVITDTNKTVDERYLRELLYKYEIQDLLDNKEDYFSDFLNLDYQFSCIEKAIHGQIEEVISMLEISWNVPIEKKK